MLLRSGEEQLLNTETVPFPASSSYKRALLPAQCSLGPVSQQGLDLPPLQLSVVLGQSWSTSVGGKSPTLVLHKGSCSMPAPSSNRSRRPEGSWRQQWSRACILGPQWERTPLRTFPSGGAALGEKHHSVVCEALHFGVSFLQQFAWALTSTTFSYHI